MKKSSKLQGVSNLGKRETLFLTTKGTKGHEKISWKWLCLRKCVVLPMNFFRVQLVSLVVKQVPV